MTGRDAGSCKAASSARPAESSPDPAATAADQKLTNLELSNFSYAKISRIRNREKIFP